VPDNFEKDKFGTLLEKSLSLKARATHLEDWSAFAKKVTTHKKDVTIAIVGKYFDTGDFVLSDAYVSVIEAVKFSAYSLGAKPTIIWMNSKHFEGDSKKVENTCKEKFSNVDGIIVPGGFGETGIEGKINVIKYAREQKIPYFGLCYGLQLMVVEYARHKLGLTGANTVEINPATKYPIIDIMESQKEHMTNGNYGGSMRLGAYPCVLAKGTTAKKAYENSKWGKVSGETHTISERHRHRFEINNAYVQDLKKAGLVFSGSSPDGKLMEIAELPKSVHPFFLGTQFHPEFLARPLNPHPLFTEFIKASLSSKK
jgi:CTP synthase